MRPKKTDTGLDTVGLLCPGQLPSCQGTGHSSSAAQQEMEEMTEEMLVQLQSDQWTLERYCHSVLTHVPPLLVSLLNRDLQLPPGKGASEGESGHTSLSPGAVATQTSVSYRLMTITIKLLGIVTESSVAGGVVDHGHNSMVSGDDRQWATMFL